MRPAELSPRPAFMAAAGIMLLAALITAATIRIRKADLAGVNPICLKWRKS